MAQNASKKLKASSSAMNQVVRRSQKIGNKTTDWENQFALSDSSREKARKIRSTLAECRNQSKSPLLSQTENRSLEIGALHQHVVIGEDQDGASVEDCAISAKRTRSSLKRVDKSKNWDPFLKVPKIEEIQILEKTLYECDALELAPRLLGKLLRRDDVVLQITEVEAYRQNDTACHGRAGITTRTAPLFGPGGHAYVYLCYGLHMMLNIVADQAGVGAAVLIRSCAPVSGMKTIQGRRKQHTDKPILLTGPGKVGQALGLTTEWSNHPLYTPGGLEILEGPPPDEILVGPRVGINYAAPEDVAALWRFAIAGTPWISAPRNTLQLLAANSASNPGKLTS